jgi:hypothetical protein
MTTQDLIRQAKLEDLKSLRESLRHFRGLNTPTAQEVIKVLLKDIRQVKK